MNNIKENDLTIGASVNRKSSVYSGKGLTTHYKVEARDSNGNLKWVDEFDNLVVTQGLNDSLEKHFKASAYTARWFVGLASGTLASVAAGDTLASKTGWFETDAYDETTRRELGWTGAAAAGSLTASGALFTINANGTTIGGAFVASSGEKNGTAGTLYGAGAFSAGDKSLDDDDTLTVTVTLTAAAA